MATLFMPFFSLATFFMPFSVCLCFEKNRFEVFPSSMGVGSLLMTNKGPIIGNIVQGGYQVWYEHFFFRMVLGPLVGGDAQHPCIS